MTTTPSPLTTLSTGSGELDHLVPRIRYFLANDSTTYFIDGRVVHGYRSPDTTPIWLRDHTHQMKGFKYFDPDVRSAIEYFLREQKDDGSLWDYVVMDPEPGTPYAEWSPKHARCEVEADVEYLAVESAFVAWQCTGNDDWIREQLPALEKAIRYTMTDPWRWSTEHQLVKRPYTVDTWDYEYGNCSPWTPEKTHLGIMHGDNSGLYQALRQLAVIHRHVGREEVAERYDVKAEELRERANALLWNGRFYRHWHALDPVEVPGVDTEAQLSLSHGYDINRGMPTHKMAVSILREYQRRREAMKDETFAEWFSIDPPFPTDSFETNEHSWTKVAGHYTNGGILPLVGGELARGAFDHGEEAYGVDILRRYSDMVRESGETYLWYHRDGRPGRSSDTTLPTDGWGSAAMLDALLCGLAGIVDTEKSYERVRISPRWVAAGEREAMVIARYPGSDAFAGYGFEANKDWTRVELMLVGTGKRAEVRVMIPPERKIAAVTVDGRKRRTKREMVGGSAYAVLGCGMNSTVELTLE